MPMLATRPRILDVADAIARRKVVTASIERVGGWYITAVDTDNHTVTVWAGGRSRTVPWRDLKDITID